MVVISHGKVEEYCDARNLTICGRYEGELSNCNSKHPIIVTDARIDKKMKSEFLKRGLLLVSIHDNDDDVWAGECLKKIAGRAAFGFRWNGGVLEEHPEAIIIARKIVELRDAGHTYKEIQEHEDVHYLNGKKMSISTIQVILKNRRKY